MSFAPFIYFLLIILVSLPDKSSCNVPSNHSRSSGVQLYHGFYKYIFENYLITNASKLENKSSAKESTDFTPFYSGIIKTVLRFTWVTKQLLILNHENCEQQRLQSLVLMLQQYIVKASCKQIKGYREIDIVEYVHASNAEIVVFLLPWFYTEILIERLTEHALDHAFYVTVEISEIFVDRMKNLYSYVKIINVLFARPNHHHCERLTPLKYSFLDKLTIKEELTHQMMICNHIETKPLRVVTVDTNDLYMSLKSRIKPDFTRLKVCDVGLPCRKSHKTVWRWYCCHGIHIDFLHLIVTELNAKYEIYIVEDNRFGNKVDGEWNGVVNEILQDKADLGLHLFNVLPSRYHVVDFTFSVSKEPDGFGILKRKTSNDYLVINWAFAKSIDGELVYISLLIALATAFVLVVIENLILKQFTDKSYSTREGISHITGVLLQKDVGGKISHTWAGQILSIFFAFSMTILISSYLARITATGIAKEHDTFEGFKDKRFKDPSYKVAIWKGAATQMFYDKLEGLKAQKIYIENEPYDEILNGKIDFYVCSPDYTDYIISQKKEFNENLQVYKEDGYKMDNGFVIQKNSILGQKITRLIMLLKSKRILYEIIDKWMIKKQNNWKIYRFPWEYAGGWVLILGATVFVCFVILLIEHLYTILKRKRVRSFDIINI